MKHIAVFLAAAGTVAIPNSAMAQDHGHLNVGAAGTNQNDALVFDEPEIFELASDFVKTLIHTNTGRFAGYFVGNLTVTALSPTPGHPAYATNAAAPGSWIFAELSSVDGPAGGQFAFWEAGAVTPTITLPTGTTGTNTWRLSESDGSSGTDPYGHIHGRRFTATLPGIYTVGFRALDFSANGTAGAPIHSASTELKIHFQAGDNIHSVQPEVNQTRVTFVARAGYNWQVQAATTLSPPNWSAIGSPVPGDDHFHEVVDASPVEGTRMFRVEGAPMVP